MYKTTIKQHNKIYKKNTKWTKLEINISKDIQGVGVELAWEIHKGETPVRVIILNIYWKFWIQEKSSLSK